MMTVDEYAKLPRGDRLKRLERVHVNGRIFLTYHYGPCRAGVGEQKEDRSF